MLSKLLRIFAKYFKIFALFHRTHYRNFTQHNTTQSDNKKRTILEMENSSSILSLPNGEKLTVRHAHVLPKLCIPNVPSYHRRIPTCSQKVIFSVIFLFSPKIHCIHFIVQLQANCSQSEARKGGVFGCFGGVCFCCPVSTTTKTFPSATNNVINYDCLYSITMLVGGRGSGNGACFVTIFITYRVYYVYMEGERTVPQPF